MPNNEANNIRINERNDIEAIIGNPPGWSLRWGMTAALIGIGLLVLLAWLVRYPDIVEARTMLTTENPPIRLVAKESARLDKFQVENRQTVKAGKILGVLENPADEKDVLALEQFLNNINQNDPSSFLSIPLLENINIGSLKNYYARFGKSFSDLKYFLEQDINYQKISNLRKQISDLERLNRSLGRQAKILMEEVEVFYSGFQRDSILLSKKSLSELEFETTKSTWLRKRRELEDLKTGTVKNDLNIRKMEAQILDLRQLRSDDENEFLLNFRSEIESLLGEIQIWKNTWLLTAPISGEVVLTNAWSEQQYVKEGEEVLTIVPNNSGAGEIIGKAYLSGPNIGKLDTGMVVLLRLDGFPYQEYGVLNGTLKNIAEAPGENGYEAQIILSENMRTSYNRKIPFRQEMQATARIITEERSYLERVLENFWATFEKN